MKSSETHTVKELSSFANMSNRGALPIKNIVCAAFILTTLYLLYIYNGSQNRLHEAQLKGSRYHREAEERVVELQNLEKAKDDFQERCENSKRELNNRVKSVNQQLSMLQSQQKETEADYLKLKQDLDVMRTERTQAENSHAQEFQALKDEKNAIIKDLQDQLRTVSVKNEEIQAAITNLQVQLQNSEGIQNTLKDQNTQLQQNLDSANQKLQIQQQNQFKPNKHLPDNSQNQGLVNPQDNQQPQKQLSQPQQQQQQQQQLQQQQQQQQQQHSQQRLFGHLDEGVKQPQQAVNQFNQNNANMNVGDNEINAVRGQNKFDYGQAAPGQDGVAGRSKLLDQMKKDLGETMKENMDALNANHQVQPPKNDDDHYDAGVADKNLDMANLDQVDKQPAVNPNDEQRGQILEPAFDGALDRHVGGGEEDGVERMNIRDMEEKREREEGGDIDLKKPLALGQMQQIQEPANIQQQDGNLDGLGQAKPPVLNEDNDNEAKEDIRRDVNPVAPNM